MWLRRISARESGKESAVAYDACPGNPSWLHEESRVKRSRVPGGNILSKRRAPCIIGAKNALQGVLGDFLIGLVMKHNHCMYDPFNCRHAQLIDGIDWSYIDIRCAEIYNDNLDGSAHVA
ncbi:hypothetical protein PG993_008764 [Apiospora rasikravindrae]|uniref:Uncharacterized protein n=1 Tax=Apiospora rasikravindrae TaxID=990691 RepID=A0ABR1SPA0_9PEZI